MRDPNFLIDQLNDNPVRTAIGVASGCAILLGIVQGINRGAFNPDPLQQQLEQKQQNSKIREQTIALANDRYDQGCEGVFYLKPNSSTYQPLTETVPVLSGDYWTRWKQNPKLKPKLTDYLPAGTTVCDAYGNVGILATVEKGQPAVITDLLNTPDRSRITKMMNRYPKSIRPQVGS